MFRAQVNCRKVSCQQKIADVKLIIKCARKSTADQKIELPIREKFLKPLAANFLSDAGVENFNRAIIDFAATYPDAISINERLVPDLAQECRAFRSQSKRDCNHRLIRPAQMFSSFAFR
jgi:adenine-specific DNA glycosylase